MARLYADHPLSLIAERLRWRAEGLGVSPAELPETDDPLYFLRIAAREDFTARIAAAMEEQLTREEEVHAASTAVPVPHAAWLVQHLAASGRQVAATTNNSARAVLAYLEGQNLRKHFGSYVHGRAADPALLKPHPDCLERALASTWHLRTA
ncbi:HAD hydrolase-like protein [Streptomyces sp. PA03-3a]|nr:HAD hydrolase-like protein [Streptomyces sp. PA03-3a]